MTTRPPMTALRKTALAAGLLYIATFVFSIPVKFGFWKGVLDDPDFVLGAGSVGAVRWGALFEVILAAAGVGTAVVLYPLARRFGERAALGFVTARVLEAAIILVGVFGILSVLTLRQDFAGSGDGTLLTARHSLVAIHDWAFLIGPGVIAAVNALCIGTVMYRSRLIPRIIPAIGLVGVPLLLASSTATLFGAWDQISGPAMLLTLPIAAWEISFGVWMTVKGFNPVPIPVPTPGDTSVATEGDV